MRARQLLVPLFILFGGCDSARPELSPEEAMGRVAANLVTTDCTRDPAAIALAWKQRCSTDQDCADAIPGTFCSEETAACDSQCDGAEHACADGKVCDCSGRCVVAEDPAVPAPTPAPALDIAPLSLQLPTGTTPTSVVLTVVTGDQEYAPPGHPPLDVFLHVARPFSLPDAQADAIQISCATNPADQTQYTSSCGLSTWSFAVNDDGKWQASRTVWVRRNPAVPASTTADVTWEIAVMSDHVAEEHDRIPVGLLSTVSVPRAGNYEGQISFLPEPGAGQPHKVTLPAKAWVNADSKVMLNAASWFMPASYVRLTGGGYDQNLFSNFPVAIDTPQLTFVNDPREPRITGKFTISLPLPTMWPANNQLKRTFEFDLTRTGNLSAKKCPCTAEGYTCDVPTQMCFKTNELPAPVSGTHNPPALSKRHPGLAKWSKETRDWLPAALDSEGGNLFPKSIYDLARSKPSGTADVYFDVAGFDLYKDDVSELGYQLCRKFFSDTSAGADFQMTPEMSTGELTCNAGPRAMPVERSEDCQSGYTWKVTNGKGACTNSAGATKPPVNFCASLYDPNRQGYGHHWGPDPVFPCPGEKVTDLATLRRDFAPCVYGKVVTDSSGDDKLDTNYDFKTDDRDYSCRSMAKRDLGLKTPPSAAQLKAFMGECKTANREAKLANGTRLAVFLCPVANSLTGPMDIDATAEHMQCLPDTAGAGVTASLVSARQNGAALKVSGDNACGTKYPTDVNLYHLRDANDEGSESQSGMFWKCIADLERDPAKPTTWQTYFDARSCISPERFFLALDVKTTAVTGAHGGDAKLVRSLQQWLGVTSFVMTQGIEEMKLSDAVGQSVPTGEQPMTWARLSDHAVQGLSLLLDPQVQKMLYAFPNLAKLASDSSAVDFDRTVVLPISMMNTISTAYRLAEAHASAVREDVYVECRDGGTSQARTDAVSEIAKLTRISAAAEIMAVQLYISTQLPMDDDKWEAAVNRMNVARTRALAAMEDLRFCRNPLGIPENYVPLFFVDAQGANQRYFASSDYLLGQARQAVSEADTELTGVRTAWMAQRAAAVQDKQKVDERNARRDDIRRAAGTVIQDLCGGTGTAASLFDRFESGNSNELTQENCYYSETPECEGVERSVDCYRGAIGEAAAGIISADMDIDLAEKNWTDLQARYDLKMQDCIELQAENAAVQQLIDGHEEQMAWLRQLRQRVRNQRTFVGALVAVGKGIASWGATIPDDGMALGFGHRLDRLTSDMEEEKEYFQNALLRREYNQKTKACFDEADIMHIGISTSMDIIARRQHDALVAWGRFKTAQDKLRFAVLDAKDAIARENGREFVPISHHYWLPEKKDTFLLRFQAAKRISYLALLALEYDLQQSLLGREEIMAAKTPAQLWAALGTPDGTPPDKQVVGKLSNLTRQVNGAVPDQFHQVIALSEILGVPGNAPEAVKKEFVRKLRAQLTSPESALYDSTTGKYLGQGVRFTLDDLNIGHRCAERVWRVAASVQGELETSDRFTTVQLYKDRNFYSNECTGPGLYHGSVRDELGLLVPRLKSNKVKAFVKAQLFGQMNTSKNSMLQPVVGGDYPGSSNEMRLMGLYGEYVLLFPVESLVELELGLVTDVYLRFDYLSVADYQEPDET